jgi:uncharacterized protein YcbX
MGESLGRVAAVVRHPVKSMQGEALDAVAVTERGLLGDRALALIDVETGKVVSAKNPRRWPSLFEFRAVFAEPPEPGRPLPPVRITLPGGATLATDAPDADARLSAELGRPVRIANQPPEGLTAEGYWPDADWLPKPDSTFEYRPPAGTFFDDAAVHLLTTASLARLRELAPQCDWVPPRFRANFLIETPPGVADFVEDGWAGKTVTVGGATLHIDRPCPRCVMTTLPQGPLPRDPAVLKTIVQNNGGALGVLATVVRAGVVRTGDSVTVA